MLGAVPHRFFPAKWLEWRRSWGMDREGLSLQARFEVSKKYAAADTAASKNDKGLILDQVVAVTGWNRDLAPWVISLRSPGSLEELVKFFV